MQPIKIQAIPRDLSGRGNSRRLRQEGRIPAVAYGKSLPSRSLAVLPADLMQVLGSERGKNSLIELTVEGQQALNVLLCDYQYHPVSRALLHADFLQIELDREVSVEVPLELTGKPQGVVLGGILRQVFRKLPVKCLPEKIPVKISHDVSALDLDDHVAVKDLALPEGVVVRLPPEQTVAAVVTEKQAPEEEAQPVAGAAPAADAAKADAAGAGKGDAAPAKAEKGKAEKK